MSDDRGGNIRKLEHSTVKGLISEQAEATKDDFLTLNRREVLAAGTAATLSGLAGCGTICPQQFEAPQATLPNPGNFGLQNGKPQRFTVKRDILGERLLINYYAGYSPMDSGAIAPVGILSTPLVSCLGQNLNPVATQQFDELMRNPQLGGQFVNMAAPQATSTNWVKGPTALDTWSGTLFNETVPVEAYTGIVGDPQETLYAVIIAMARNRGQSEAVLVGSGTAKSLPPETNPSGFDVVPAAFSQTEVSQVKQLILGVLPRVVKQSPSPSTGYGAGGYGQGRYGGISA